MWKPLHERLLSFARSHGFDTALNIDGSVTVSIPWHRDNEFGEREYGADLIRCATFGELRRALGY